MRWSAISGAGAMLRLASNFLSGEDGMTFLEYGMITALVSAVMIVALKIGA
jgi:Flp pilus assembly pilin Flp